MPLSQDASDNKDRRISSLTLLKTMYKSVMSKVQREIKNSPSKRRVNEILKIFSRRGIVSDVLT